MSIEILTRLNPKVSNMENIGISTAGGLTASDVAMACSNCEDIGYLALKRRILGDTAPCSGYYRLYSRVVKLAQRKGWKHRSKAIGAGQLRKLLDICLDDYFNLFKCDRCHATGVIPIKEDSPITTTCTKCSGAKLRARFDYERAQAMGLSKAGYSRNWQERHSQVMLLLSSIIPNKESNAEYEIRKLMR